MCLFVFFLYAYYTDQNIIQLGCASQELLLLNLTLHRVPNIPIITNTTYIYISNFLTHKMCVYIYVGVCLCQCKKTCIEYIDIRYTLFSVLVFEKHILYTSPTCPAGSQARLSRALLAPPPTEAGWI
jgi:hypothetical protein